MALSNDYKDCQVFDLDPADIRRGPFIVVQTSRDEEDPAQAERLYILRRDGVWVEYVTQAILHPEARGDLCFETLSEIVALLNSLPPTARVERARLDPARQKEFERQVNAAGGLLALIQAEVRCLQAAPPAEKKSAGGKQGEQ